MATTKTYIINNGNSSLYFIEAAFQWRFGGPASIIEAITVRSHSMLHLTRRLIRRLAYFAELLDPITYPCPYPRCMSPVVFRLDW